MLIFGIILLQASCVIVQGNSTALGVSPSVTASPISSTVSQAAHDPPSPIPSGTASASASQQNNGSAQASTTPLQGVNNTAAAQPSPSQSEATLTLELASSLFSPSATAGQQAPTTPAVDPPSGACDNLNWTPVLQSCSTKKCVKDSAAKLEKLAKCQQSKPANVSTFSVVSMVEAYGKQLAQYYQTHGMGVNETGYVFSTSFVFGSGVIGGASINDTKLEHMAFPDYSNPDHFTGPWQQLRDEIKIPPSVLRQKGLHSASYTWSVFPDLYKSAALTKNDIEMDHMAMIADSETSDLYVDDSGRLITKKKFPAVKINSDFFSFTCIPSLRQLSKPVLITLRHKKVEGYEHPRCVFWNKNKRILSSDGCKVHETNETHTICACNHLTSFAVAMKAKMLDDTSDRQMVVTIAWVLSSISLLCLLLCGICIIVVGYHFLDNMRIALNLDVSLVLSHLVFYIGLSTSQTKFYSDASVCEVVSPFVHMFQLAALTWLLMEGMHYVSQFKRIFNRDNTQSWFFYASVGWGVPIAFAAACAGYTYPHSGTPKPAEFCWLSIQGSEAWYFGGPILILVLLNLLVRAFVLKEVMMWKGNPDDRKIERTRSRLLSFIVLLPVIILTWLFGVLAANNSEDKAYHYLFIVFYTLQGILVAVFYCAKNAELWDHLREKKEAELKEKNAVFTFQYIP